MLSKFVICMPLSVRSKISNRKYFVCFINKYNSDITEELNNWIMISSEWSKICIISLWIATKLTHLNKFGSVWKVTAVEKTFKTSFDKAIDICRLWRDSLTTTNVFLPNCKYSQRWKACYLQSKTLLTKLRRFTTIRAELGTKKDSPINCTLGSRH